MCHLTKVSVFMEEIYCKITLIYACYEIWSIMSCYSKEMIQIE